MIDPVLTSEAILNSLTCIGDLSRASGHLRYSLRARLTNSDVQSLLTCMSRIKMVLILCGFSKMSL